MAVSLVPGILMGWLLALWQSPLRAIVQGVVMLPRDLREPTRIAAQSASNKLTKRLAKGEKKNRKRMATVAAVYSTPGEDVYVLLVGWDETAGRTATFKIYVNPLVTWVCAGGQTLKPGQTVAGGAAAFGAP